MRSYGRIYTGKQPVHHLRGVWMSAVTDGHGFESLRGALPRIAHFVGKTIVLKVGGSVGIEPWILEDIAALHRMGIHMVVVHGGGPMISDWQGPVGI